MSAQKLVARFGSLQTLLARVAEVESARLRTQLRDNAAQLLRNEQLLRLCSDVPLPGTLEARPLDQAALARTRALFEAWEFLSLLPRLAQAAT